MKMNGTQSKVASLKIARERSDRLVAAGQFKEAAKLANDVLTALNCTVATTDYDALQVIAALAYSIETSPVTPGFRTEINGHKVSIVNGGAGAYNVNVDGLHCAKCDDFDAAMSKAKDICFVDNKY